MRTLDPDTADLLRDAVMDAMQFWPNAHLGTYTRRDDLRSAFRMIRSWLKAGDTIQAAIGRVANDALRHMDM